MAACLSPSPSGRRLSELLEEKQEPFLLDMHLLEKGCSSRILDGYDTALCWPAAPGNDAAAVLKRLTSNKSKKAATTATARSRGGGGILKILLSKVLRGGKQQQAASRGRKLQFSDSFKVAPAPCAAVDHLEEQQEAEKRYDYDSDSDEDDEKQLSPVSVLDHPFDAKLLSSPFKNHATDVFRDLLDAAYSPALLTQLLARSDDLATDTTSTSSSSSSSCSAAADDTDDDDEDWYGHRASSPKNNGRRHDGAAYWEAHRAELALVSELVASEVPNARLDHATSALLLPEREDVGAAVAAGMLEALLRELVVDLATC